MLYLLITSILVNLILLAIKIKKNFMVKITKILILIVNLSLLNFVVLKIA